LFVLPGFQREEKRKKEEEKRGTIIIFGQEGTGTNNQAQK